MKRLAGLTALALAVSTLNGCSWLTGEDGYFRNRSSDYLKSRQAAPLKLPEGVQARRSEELLPIPYNVPLDPTQAVFELPRPRTMAVAAERSDFSLQRSGEQRWLVAQRAPVEVWPLVRQFLGESGLQVIEERQQSGEMLTHWKAAEKLPAGVIRDLDDADEKEVAFRVRIEPGAQRNSSEIFLISNQRKLGSQAEPEWPRIPAEPKLDAALLEQLQINLAASSGRSGSVSLLAGRNFDTPGRVLMGRDGNGNPQLTLSTDMDRAWSAIGRALGDANVRVDDLNRSLGIYYINLAEDAQKPGDTPGLFSNLLGSKDAAAVEARAERYQVRLTSVGDSVKVSVDKNTDTVAPVDVARRVLGLIQDKLD